MSGRHDEPQPCYEFWGAHNEHLCCIPPEDHADDLTWHECDCGSEYDSRPRPKRRKAVTK